MTCVCRVLAAQASPSNILAGGAYVSIFCLTMSIHPICFTINLPPPAPTRTVLVAPGGHFVLVLHSGEDSTELLSLL